MSVNNFIPEVWAPTMLKALKRKTIFARDCFDAYEGDIKKAGNVITFKELGDPTVHEVAFEDRNKEIADSETLEDASLDMAIRQIRDVHFELDDIDEAIAKGNLKQMMENKVPTKIANVIDRYIASLAGGKDAPLLYKGEPVVITETNVLTVLDDAIEQLQDNDVPEGEQIYIKCSNRFYNIAHRAYVGLDTSNSESISTGRIGEYGGAKMQRTNNLYKKDGVQYICVHTKPFIGYADAFTKVEAYRPQKKFCDAVKGRYLFDAKIIRHKMGLYIPVKFA